MAIWKSILKKILPIPFLKKVFLWYNSIKINTLDRILYKTFILSESDFVINRTDYPFRNESINLVDLEGRAEYAYMFKWLDWSEEEFLLDFNRRCTIEPVNGWAIVGANTLVYQSLSLSRTKHMRKPDLFNYWFKTNIQYVDQAISLRDTGEENYFHFYNDVLTKILLIGGSGFSVTSFPIIISKKLWDKSYFQHYLKASTLLQSLQWIVQDQQYIVCNRIIFCKPLTHRMDLLLPIFAPLRAEGKGNRKIFLTRSKSRLRYIENAHEIEDICSAYGFETVDTDSLDLPQQIDLFSNSSFIVGIHGAGLTNMMFRKEHCKILEIFPPPDLGYLPFHYIMMAKLQGFRYRGIIGEKGKRRYSGGFQLSVAEFERNLNDFL